MPTAKDIREKFLAMEQAKNALEEAQPNLTMPLGDGVYCQVNVNSNGLFIGRTAQTPVWLTDGHVRELRRLLNELYPD